MLDSGALYRATALAALQARTSTPTTKPALAALAAQLDLRFEDGRALLAGADVTDALRLEDGRRAGLAHLGAGRRCAQRCTTCSCRFAALPGLVADGRDMGTVVFPDAALKVFLTASAATRAERRHKQLISKGISANIDSLRADLEARDARDIRRAALAP